jgi:L-seryl-tRNA(Ser) seleniumtransferase
MSGGQQRPDLNARLRALPSVSAVLERPSVRERIAEHGLPAVTRAVRLALEASRTALLAGAEGPTDIADVEIDAALLAPPSLRPAVNATGVIVHTNLGRAPLPAAALEAVMEVGTSYSTLEYDVDAGRRGNRHHHASELLKDLTGAEDAAVVNNCAAAVMLALSAVARDREVIVSRGELIEIGGGFRVPDVMAQSGARLVEVGTTNRTWARDYEQAIGEQTAALMKVHRSNFDLVGFTHEVDVAELASVASGRGLPVLVDAGSGCLRALEGAPGEQPVSQLLREGADLVMFSGDKLLGGPQAGLLVGSAALIERVRKHPLMRALRPDKMTLAALTATLRLWRDRPADVPVWAMANMTLEELRRRAAPMVDALSRLPTTTAALVDTRAQFGGGTTPSAGRASVAVSIAVEGLSAAALEAQLRRASPPIIARIEEDRLLLDLLCVRPEEDAHLTATVLAAVGGARG